MNDGVKDNPPNEPNSVREYPDRIEYYDNAGRLHREKGPAVVRVGQVKEFWNHGVLVQVDWPSGVSEHFHSGNKSYTYRDAKRR